VVVDDNSTPTPGISGAPGIERSVQALSAEPKNNHNRAQALGHKGI
jgi:hypothetical protein